MSNLSNMYGRAYEFAYLLTFTGVLKLHNIEIEVDKNSSFFASKSAWDALDETTHNKYLLSATAGVNAILDAEPLILEDDGSDRLIIKIQPDGAGEEGDVRDILIIRRGIQWEIGLSVKHNHFAVKHSRLSGKIDFGDKWFGIPCSQEYWNEINPIFAYLKEEKRKGKNWSELPSKENDVYIPLLTAFLNEVRRSYNIHGAVVAVK